MADDEAVLFANEAFYRAFADRDVKAMDEVWAQGVPVACIHPGWNALEGRDDVMESWRSILGGNAPAIRCVSPQVMVHGGLAVVVCYEDLGASHLVATNIFVREGRVWKMVHHQAGPTAYPVPEEDEESGSIH